MFRVGIDTGGTFTDFVRLDRAGLTVHKVRTSTADPTEAILNGLDQLGAGSRAAAVVHGSTVATNAVLERTGARVALVTTAGFEDVLAIGRQTRPELYNVFVPPRRPIVEAGLTFSVNERIDARGRVLEPINAAAVAEVATAIRAAGAEIAAVCFLHSYRSADHEREVAGLLRRAGIVVCASHEVLPEYREYERWSTTAVNAYVTPLIDRYLARLESALGRTHLSIMQSNGGSISAGAARAQAVRTVLSGPAAGVVGARTAARAAGFRRVISFDMGGTSTDVSLVDDDVPMTTETSIGDVPVRLPAIDVHTVGAGGGSIARLDRGGALRVGPESAGGSPGPVCYGTGTELTVTDANLLLGRLDPEYFLGGRMGLDVERTRRTAETAARRMKLSVEALAEGIVRVVNASMERAIRAVSLERGHDPRRFALVAFGGAGGMHACEVGAELGLETILVPRHAGVLSAFGMLAADVTRDYSIAVLQPSGALSMNGLNRRVAPLVARARRELRREGFSGRQLALERQLDLRYLGQSYEIPVPWSANYEQEFHRYHRRLYGYASIGRPTEVVALRVRAVGLTEKPALPRAASRRRAAPAALRRPARFSGRTVRTAFHRWDALGPGMHGSGPAVIAGGEATIVVPPSFDFEVDGFSNVVLRRQR